MKVLLTAALVFLVGCSGGPATQAESSAGGTPDPTYSLGGGGGGGGANPCGYTYHIVMTLPDGTKVTKDEPVYCTIWDGDFGDPPPELKQKWSVDPGPGDHVVTVVQPGRQER